MAPLGRSGAVIGICMAQKSGNVTIMRPIGLRLGRSGQLLPVLISGGRRVVATRGQGNGVGTSEATGGSSLLNLRDLSAPAANRRSR